MEDNIMIAEFMGYEYYFGQPFDNLQYHSSWDWLMPVVDKIENISSFRLEFYGCNVNWNGLPPTVTGNTKIEATYKAVVEFIKWYNENK